MRLLILIAVLLVLASPGRAQNKAADSTQPNASANQSQPHALASPVVKADAAQGNQEQAPGITGQAVERRVRITAPVTVNATKDHWDKWLVICTALLVIVGGFQIWFLWKTVNVAGTNTQTLIEIERPWVLVDTGVIPDDFQPTPDRVGILEIRPVVKNYGRTLARITRLSIRQHQVENTAALPAEPLYENEEDVDIVLPQGVVIQPMRVAIALSDFTAIREGAKVLYIYGYINYMVGGSTRQSRYCIIYHIPRGFDPATRGFYLAQRVPPAYIRCT
jgi:hypothetical protein